MHSQSIVKAQRICAMITACRKHMTKSYMNRQYIYHHEEKKSSEFFSNSELLENGGDLLSHGCAVPSARLCLTSLFGMGRGGTTVL